MNDTRARRLRMALNVLFSLFIGGMGVLYLLLPHSDWSEQEKRALTTLTAPTVSTLADGTWTSRFEDWMSDHAPGRAGWVTINAHMALWSGRNGLQGVIRGQSGRLYATPEPLDEAMLRRRTEKIRLFAEETGLDCAVMVVPHSAYINEDDMPTLHEAYPDEEALSLLGDTLGDVTLISLADAYTSVLEKQALYYATDHHYTALGAYIAFRTYMSELGQSAPSQNEFDIEAYGGFYGSMYARAGLWETPSETIELWRHPLQEDVVVTFDDRGRADTLFFTEHLSEMDKYPTYLDGNHALVDIDTGRSEGETLLIVRDSFGHCFAPFAATAFRRVVLVDLRYYHLPVSDLAAEVGADRVLFLYGMDTLIEGGSLEWLR